MPQWKEGVARLEFRQTRFALLGGGSAGLSGLALGKPVRLSIHLEDVDMMGQPIEESAGKAFFAKGGGPLIEGQVRGDDRRAPLVTLAYQLKEQFGARYAQMLVTAVIRRRFEVA